MVHRLLLLFTLLSTALSFMPPTFAAPRASTSLSATRERTYIMVKPDGVQRGLVGDIVGRFEKKGYKLSAIKTKMASKELLDQHYQDLVSKVRVTLCRRMRIRPFVSNDAYVPSAILSRAQGLHDVRTRLLHGLGGHRCRQDRAQGERPFDVLKRQAVVSS